MQTLEEIGQPDNAEAFTRQALAEKRRLMGFGHRVYKAGDPRAKILRTLATKACRNSAEPVWFETAVKLHEAVNREKGLIPNVDFYSAPLFKALGHPRRPVRPGDRRLPDRRLDRQPPRAVRRQPADPSARGLRRAGGSRVPAAVRAGRLMPERPRPEARAPGTWSRASPCPGRRSASGGPGSPHRHERHDGLAPVRGHGLRPRQGARPWSPTRTTRSTSSTRGTPRTTATSRRPPAASAATTRSPATASATRSTSRPSERRGSPFSASDSHTPLCGALGMLAIGAGGLDVACAMGGSPYYFPLPRVIQVVLTGRLRPWVAAKDVILELLRRLTVRGGFGKIFEYAGPGVADPHRAPARDDREHGRGAGAHHVGLPLRRGDAGIPRAPRPRRGLAAARRRPRSAPTTTTIEIDLSAIEPLVALPGSPDHVVPVEEVEGTSIEQVLVGSCTNGSWEDMSVVAEVLRGRRVHPDVSFVLFPASQQILETMARQGLVADLIAAGAVISESTCGACPGIGHVPATGSKSLRAFNRNFPGRSGVKGDQIYLSSTQTACVSALRGHDHGPSACSARRPQMVFPARFATSTAGLVPPGLGRQDAPPSSRVPTSARCPSGDRRTTRSPAPSSSSSATRSRPTTSRRRAPRCWCSARTCRRSPSSRSGTWTPTSSAGPKAAGGGFIVAGQTYGQGSSREAAAIGPMFLGRPRGAGQELRPDPPREPDQLGRAPPGVRRPRGLRRGRRRSSAPDRRRPRRA